MFWQVKPPMITLMDILITELLRQIWEQFEEVQGKEFKLNRVGCTKKVIFLECLFPNFEHLKICIYVYMNVLIASYM